MIYAFISEDRQEVYRYLLEHPDILKGTFRSFKPGEDYKPRMEALAKKHGESLYIVIDMRPRRVHQGVEYV